MKHPDTKLTVESKSAVVLSALYFAVTTMGGKEIDTFNSISEVSLEITLKWRVGAWEKWV